ncbi:expressed unknown protein [Ectocarpus siliculosus]|uniref:Uncharacterized protein n=1 Tax=Ectocarpus siliculosus TaxID=2880 RepID=D8LBI8_ECTSI|nr:expressed unknown protein [Ectocarpus siliculosus]|eukprot:CBN76697.1 expressed unknown protein [Ectocarpus siliculosus]
MPPSPPQVLFFGEFRPKETGELDEVKFREAVVARIIHVVPAGEQPTQVALPPTFRGITQVEPFQLEVFCKNLNNLHSKYFDRLMPTATVPGGAVYTMPQDIVTNHLVIRGSFQAMSVVICGTVVPRTALSPDAIQALTVSDKPPLGGPSPPPSALVPPPPPRPSPPPNSHQQQMQQPQAMAVDGPPPPPPPARPATQAPPAASAAVVGGTAAPAAAAAAAPRKRTVPKAASSSSSSDKPSSPPPPAASPSGPGPSKDSSSLPKAWAPLALPAAAATAAAVGQGGTTGDGVSPADLAPYGEAELSTALTVPPERLQRSAAEANPFDDRFLVPADAARGVKEAVARLVSLADESGPAGRNLECEALDAAADCVEACFRRQTPAKKGEEGGQQGGLVPSPVAVEQGSTVATTGTTATVVPSSEAFNDDVSGPLATAVIRSLRFFRAAAAGTEAGSIPAGEGEEERGGGRHTPAVAVLADGSVTVDDGHRRVALAGLRLAGAVATAPSPAGALLAAGGFHVLWRLPLDPAATPMGVALALGALCQGIRHADVLRVFLTRWEEGVDDGAGGAEAEGLSRLGGYEACASVLSRQVAHPAALSRGRSIMQYVALVECLQLVRKLATKAGTTVAAAKAAEATGKDGSAGGGGGAAAAVAAAAGPAAVKGMEDLAHALGALEALMSEGAGETSASGIQPGIRKGDRKRRLQGFEVLLAKAARDKRPRGGLAPSLVALLWEHQLPAALAAGVAAAALASEKEAASSSAAMMSRVKEGAAAGGGGGERGGGEEGPASAAAALVFAGVRQVALRLLRGAGDPLSGALVFAGQPRSTAALAYGLDPSALATPVGPESSPTIEALADGLDQTLVTPGGLARLLVRSCQALSAADLALSTADKSPQAGRGGMVIDGGGGTAAGGGGKTGAASSAGGGGVAGATTGILSGGAEADMTAALRKLHELGPSLAGRSSVCEVACRFALPAVLNPPPGGGRASVTVTTSLLLWLLEGDQESCSDVLAERWGSLRSRVDALADEVGWSDSLSHRLYLFHTAMGMVAMDAKKPAAAAGGSRRSKGGGSGDLPRAGEMMAGLARQSHTLAVYLGLEDVPDASGSLLTPRCPRYHRRGKVHHTHTPFSSLTFSVTIRRGGGHEQPFPLNTNTTPAASASDTDAGAGGTAADGDAASSSSRKPPPALQPRTEEERRRAAAPVIVALTLRLKVLALAASRGLGASYPAFAGGAAVPALAGLVEILAFGLAKAGANRALAHRQQPQPLPPPLEAPAVPAPAPEPAAQPPRLKDPSKEPLLLVGDLFTAPGPGEAEEGELRWEQEPGGVVSEQRGLEAAEHEARLLTCALPALRLLRHCLGRLSDAGAEPPVGPLDAVGALLDFEAALAMLPLDLPPSSLPPGSDVKPSPSRGESWDLGATPSVALALRAEALVLSSCRLWCPPRPWSRLRRNGGGGGSSSSFLHRVSAHALACPANHMSGARLLTALLPPESPAALHRLVLPVATAAAAAAGVAAAAAADSSTSDGGSVGRLVGRVHTAAALEQSEGFRRQAVAALERRVREMLKRWDVCVAGDLFPLKEAAAAEAGPDVDGGGAGEEGTGDKSGNGAFDGGGGGGGGWRPSLETNPVLAVTAPGVVNVPAVVLSLCHSASPVLHGRVLELARRAVGIGPMTARALCASLVRSLIGCIERYMGQSQPLDGRSDKDREVSWESVCRVLTVILAVSDNPHSGAGRVGLLLGGVIEALMPCLGLPKPEVIRSALEVLCSFVEGARVSEVRRYSEPACSFGTLATAARNVVAKWHRVDLHVHAWGARLLATLAAQPSVAADALQALKPRGAEAAGVEAQEGKTTMLLPRLYAGLQKGLEDTGNRYKHRLSLLKGGRVSEQKGLDLDRRVLRLVRAACWAIQVPLALMEEGLVDAAVVAGVLSPKGKASPQEEPLFKIKAAAEAFRDLRKSIVDTLEAEASKKLQAGAKTATTPSSAVAVAAAAAAAAVGGGEGTGVHALLTGLMASERYLVGLVDGTGRLWAACEAVRGTSTNRNPPVKDENSGPTGTAEEWFGSTSRKIVATWQAGKGEGAGGGGAGLWEELRQGREAWLERGPCMGRARLSAVMSDERLTAALLWRTEAAELEKAVAGRGAGAGAAAGRGETAPRFQARPAARAAGSGSHAAVVAAAAAAAAAAAGAGGAGRKRPRDGKSLPFGAGLMARGGGGAPRVLPATLGAMMDLASKDPAEFTREMNDNKRGGRGKGDRRGV